MISKVINKIKYLNADIERKKNSKRLYLDAKSELTRSKGSRRLIVFQTPVHSNIGDHAIALAQFSFLNKKCPDFEIIEVNQLIQNDIIKNCRELFNDNDIITLIGGGNFGNQYITEENLRRNVIDNFPSNKIIVFPQTVYYTNDKGGSYELSISQSIFSKHKNLTFDAREKVSYDLMKDYFPQNRIILTPDIVLSYQTNITNNREGALVVFRDDEEAVITEVNRNLLISKLDRLFPREVRRTDMHVKGRKRVYTPEFRDEVVSEKFKEFAASKIAITDRLHGMVFALLTGTPCVVLSNYNQKVSGTYEWIKNYPFIKFVNSVEEAIIAIDELSEIMDQEFRYDSSLLMDAFLPLENAIKN